MNLVKKIRDQLKKEQRRIIFFFDEDKSHTEELSTIEEAGFSVVLVDNNYFEVKYKLEFELKDQEVVLYHTIPHPATKNLKKYPLLDLLIANTELRLDPVSEFLQEYRLNTMHQPIIKQYFNQIKTKTARKKLAKILDPQHFSDSNLKLGLIAMQLDFNSIPDRYACIAKWLYLATEPKNFKRVNTKLIELDLEDEFKLWIHKLTDIKASELSLEKAKEIAVKIKYNVLTAFIEKTVKEDTYTKLKLEQTADINRLMVFFKEWEKDTSLKTYIDPVFDELGTSINVENIITWYGLDAQYGYYSEKITMSIINELYENVDTDPLKTSDIAFQWMRDPDVTENVKHQFKFIYHSCEVYTTLNAYKNFRFNTLDDYIKEYTSELYKVDANYRKALLEYEAVKNILYQFEALAQIVFSKLNDTYDHFLKSLNVEWQKLLEEKHFDYSNISLPKQYDFYKDNLSDFKFKVVVIISDAFRYELAKDLYDDLIVNSKNQLKLEATIASIPSYTNLGMSNLLPNSGITADQGTKDITFKINNIATHSTNREKILKLAEPESKTLGFSDMKKMAKEEKRAFFKDSRITYLYHDWIDAIGDKKGTEHATFEATRQANADLEWMIRNLSGEMGISYIMVTSDHGFIFNYNQLNEPNRENFPESETVIKDHSRFVIADKFIKKVDGYTFPLKNTTNIETEYQVAIPRAINRYKKQGNIGLQFVHGGASLQEVVIPVLKYYKQSTAEIQKTVSFKRIDENTKILSGSLKLTLLQNEPVSNDLRSVEIVFGLYSESGELYSNEIQIHFNATSTNPRERIFEEILSLNAKGSQVSFCYLKAYDVKDKERLNPVSLNDLIKISSLTSKDEF
jgi:uncharacterized protein (TIGR02687 family)